MQTRSEKARANSRAPLGLAKALLRAEPYFGSALAAAQSPPLRHAYLNALVRLVASTQPERPLRILEVGSWVGASAVALAMAVRMWALSGRVLCIDHWKPYFDLSVETGSRYAEMATAAADGDAYRLFLHNVKASGVSDIVDHIVSDSRSALPKLAKEDFDLVYLDGSHKYEDIRDDIKNAKLLVREGGILCGDDLELSLEQVDPEGHLAALASGKDIFRDAKAGIHYHPGVTQAVAEAFSSCSVFSGLWVTQRVGAEWRAVSLDHPEPDIYAEGPAISRDFEEPETPAEPQLICTFGDYNIVEHEGNYFGIHKELGQVDLYQPLDPLQQRFDPTKFFLNADFAVVLAQVSAAEYTNGLSRVRAEISEAVKNAHTSAQLHGNEETPKRPIMIGGFADFNIVQYEDRVYAIRRRLGHVDVSGDPQQLQAAFNPDDLIVGEDVIAVLAELVEREFRLVRSGSSTAMSGLAEKIANEQRQLLASEITRLEISLLNSTRETVRTETDAVLRLLTEAGNRQQQRLETSLAQLERKLDREIALTNELRGMFGSVKSRLVGNVECQGDFLRHRIYSRRDGWFALPAEMNGVDTSELDLQSRPGVISSLGPLRLKLKIASSHIRRMLGRFG